jgi:hypothetical protein
MKKISKILLGISTFGIATFIAYNKLKNKKIDDIKNKIKRDERIKRRIKEYNQDEDDYPYDEISG